MTSEAFETLFPSLAIDRDRDYKGLHRAVKSGRGKHRKPPYGAIDWAITFWYNSILFVIFAGLGSMK